MELKCPASHDCFVIRVSVGFQGGVILVERFRVRIGHDGRDEVADFLDFLLASCRDQVTCDGLCGEQRSAFDADFRHGLGIFAAFEGLDCELHHELVGGQGAPLSTSPEGRPRKVKLVPVKGFRKREIARGAKRWLAPGSEVLTDGLRCWNALDGVVGSHRAIRTGSGRQAARMAPFKWVNTTLGNIKSAITGTYRKLGPDHAQRYLASFAWRYNRRYQLNTMIPRFVHSAARTQPIPYRALIAG